MTRTRTAPGEVPARRRQRLDVNAGTALVGLILLLVVAIDSVDSPAWSYDNDLVVIAVFGAVMVVGELWRIATPGASDQAPITISASFAFAMTTVSPVGHPVIFGPEVVVTVTGLALIVGGGVAYLRGRPVHPVSSTCRLLATATVALAYRTALPGQQSLATRDTLASSRWPIALVMLAVSAFGLAVQATCSGALTAVRDETPVRQRIIDAYRENLGMSLAMGATGTLIALAERPLGPSAIPLFVVPLLLTQFAVRRAQAVADTHRQTIRMLSRVTELGRYTTPEHADRVARIGVAISRDLGLPERACANVEYAALLHDIGQVALVEPIPGGATSQAAPVDQNRIAADSARIVTESGVPDDVARIVAAQATQFRLHRELGEEIPVESRILKVANAFDDFVGDRVGDEVTERAIERIVLGLGYEYDPRVVEALVRVVARR